MAKIRTVLGDKDPAEMGHILPHEHTFPHLLAAKSDHASVFDREKAVEEGAATLRAVSAEQGVSGLVDCAPYDLGRDMGLLMGLSRASVTGLGTLLRRRGYLVSGVIRPTGKDRVMQL